MHSFTSSKPPLNCSSHLPSYLQHRKPCYHGPAVYHAALLPPYRPALPLLPLGHFLLFSKLPSIITWLVVIPPIFFSLSLHAHTHSCALYATPVRAVPNKLTLTTHMSGCVSCFRIFSPSSPSHNLPAFPFFSLLEAKVSSFRLSKPCNSSPEFPPNLPSLSCSLQLTTQAPPSRWSPLLSIAIFLAPAAAGLAKLFMGAAVLEASHWLSPDTVSSKALYSLPLQISSCSLSSCPFGFSHSPRPGYPLQVCAQILSFLCSAVGS